MTTVQLRARFGALDNGFHVILVGKDSGAKLTQLSPLGSATFFSFIDAMLMSLNEIQRGR